MHDHNGVKMNLPEFIGEGEHGVFLDWIVNMENGFTTISTPDDKGVAFALA